MKMSSLITLKKVMDSYWSVWLEGTRDQSSVIFLKCSKSGVTCFLV